MVLKRIVADKVADDYWNDARKTSKKKTREKLILQHEKNILLESKAGVNKEYSVILPNSYIGKIPTKTTNFES